MQAPRQRNLFLALLGLGAAALVVDRAFLQPSAAGAAPMASRAATGRAAAESPEPRADSLPAPSVPALAGRIDALDAPQVTPDIFKADPAEWGLPAPGADATARAAPQVELRLGAIMNADAGVADQAASCAVINSRIVGVGGTVAGFVVERITPTSVHMRRGEETRELRLSR